MQKLAMFNLCTAKKQKKRCVKRQCYSLDTSIIEYTFDSLHKVCF